MFVGIIFCDLYPKIMSVDLMFAIPPHKHVNTLHGIFGALRIPVFLNPLGVN